MKKYFANKATGLNADIYRHSEKEKFLREKIAEMEQSGDKTDERYLNAYKSILGALLDSKAEVTSKIGKK